MNVVLNRWKGSLAVAAVCVCVVSIPSWASADTVFYNGAVTPTTLGQTLETGLQEFDSSLGTLTGVDITLALYVAPFAEIFSLVESGETFDTDESVSYAYDSSSNTIDLTRGSDSWTLTTPTVSTGIISGEGQAIPALPGTLKLPGSDSALLNWSSSGGNLGEYIGTGTLSFGTTGTGQFGSTGLSFPVFVGGGADLTGTASVTYTYTAVPTPSAIAGLAGMGIVGLFAVAWRRRRRNPS
jgi:hypothetical protein